MLVESKLWPLIIERSKYWVQAPQVLTVCDINDYNITDIPSLDTSLFESHTEEIKKDTYHTDILNCRL